MTFEKPSSSIFLKICSDSNVFGRYIELDERSASLCVHECFKKIVQTDLQIYQEVQDHEEQSFKSNLFSKYIVFESDL